MNRYCIDLSEGAGAAMLEAIRFLLQQGVDPYPSNSKGLSIKSLAGMRKVEKYFNKSWDDLVQGVKAKRASMTDERIGRPL